MFFLNLKALSTNLNFERKKKEEDFHQGKHLGHKQAHNSLICLNILHRNKWKKKSTFYLKIMDVLLMLIKSYIS